MFDPLSIGITVGSTLLGGISSFFSDQSAESKLRAQIKRAQQEAEKSLISGPELEKRLRDIDRLFNKRLISTLNTTALRTRQYANNNVVGAAVAGQIGAQADETKIQAETAINDRNAQIRQYIASLGANAPVGDPIGSLVSGALAGAQVGVQASDIINREGINIPKEQPGIGTSQGGTLNNGQYGIIDYFRGGRQSPFGSKINDEELFNFSMPSALQRIFREY